MFQQNILNLGIYMAVKNDGHKPAGNAYVTSPSAAIAPRKGLDGVWDSPEGETIQIQGNYFRIYEDGEEIDAGTFQLEGNVMHTQSAYTGVITSFSFEVRGDVMQLADGYGEAYHYQRRP